MEITFYRKLANKLADAVIANTEYTENEAKRVRYGLVCIFSDLYKFIFMLIVFSLFSWTREYLIAALGSLPIRLFLGGYHAKNEIACIFISFLTMLISVILGNINLIPVFVQAILLIILPILGVIFAPVRTKKVEERKTVYKIAIGITTPVMILINYFIASNQILLISVIQIYILAIYQVIKNYTKFKIITNTQNI